MKPLEGIRVVEAATLFAAPIAGMLLGDYGADVVKLEHPRRPDPARGHGPAKDGVGLWFKTLARNKRLATLDLSQPAGAGRVIAARPDAIFHLAGVVSGEAELDFEKGYRVNLDGTRALLEAIRTAGDGYKPKVIYTSSIAVFGAPFPPSIPDDFHPTPLTSYGTQKAMGELLLADYSRRGLCAGIGIRLPTIVVRPGKPNAAASGFFSTAALPGSAPLAIGIPTMLPHSVQLPS